MPDSHKNFAYSTVATAPSPADSGTSLVVAAGDGTKFPAVSFNATVWPTGAQPLTTNAEIVRITNISTDTFTITRTQESTSARSIVVGDQIAATISAKTLTDVEQANLLDGVKADTVVQTVSRGSLIYGNSTPKWDELVVGAANTVLVSDGTDVSWSAAPRFPNWADAGGINRITLATTTPQVTITGDLKIASPGVLNIPYGGGGSNSGAINILPSSGNVDSWSAIQINPTLTVNDGGGVAAISGAATFKIAANGAAFFVRALNFVVLVRADGAGTSVVLDIAAIRAQVQLNSPTGYALAPANVAGLYVSAPTMTRAGTGTVSVTNYYNIWIPAFAMSSAGISITTGYGLFMGDITGTGFSTKYLLEIGSSTPTTTSGLFRMIGNFTAAANATPIYISEGATPTLRQLRTRVWDGTAGHGFTNGDLVCYLV